MIESGHVGAGEVEAEAFCLGAPTDVDLSSFRTKAWSAERFIQDGEVLDLGGRVLEVLHVPGHTPDSMALLDAERGLLFTGDTFYDGGLWLQVPETNLHDFQASITRLAELEERLNYLFGGHGSARVEAGRLRPIGTAITEILSGGSGAGEVDGHRIVFKIDGVEIVTTRNALDGKQSDQATGGSGLDVWPR